VQTPQYRFDSLDALLNMPVSGTGNPTAANSGSTQLLGNLVDVQPNRQPAIVSRYNITPAVDVFVGVQGTDLASVAGEVEKLVYQAGPSCRAAVR